MRIIWNGHSCFTLETTQGTIVLDPYADGSVPGYPPLALRADLVCCSHGHADHCAPQAVTLTDAPCTVEIEELPTFHDDQDGSLRGPNTIRIFHAEGLRVAHLGDLGCALSPEQMQALTHLDALMIPVGGYYTIDAQQAHDLAEQLQPRIIIPMHYRGTGFGYDVIAPLDDFLSLCSLPIRQVGHSIELTAQTEPQIAVFTWKDPA